MAAGDDIKSQALESIRDPELKAIRQEAARRREIEEQILAIGQKPENIEAIRLIWAAHQTYKELNPEATDNELDEKIAEAVKRRTEALGNLDKSYVDKSVWEKREIEKKSIETGERLSTYVIGYDGKMVANVGEGRKVERVYAAYLEYRDAHPNASDEERRILLSCLLNPSVLS